ncbi:MAG: hypothetical protein IT376_16480 [Polyangiaceae bacterium]|nr:hypothetical protein [Polyangiaceae bacterium]
MTSREEHARPRERPDSAPRSWGAGPWSGRRPAGWGRALVASLAAILGAAGARAEEPHAQLERRCAGGACQQLREPCGRWGALGVESAAACEAAGWEPGTEGLGSDSYARVAVFTGVQTLGQPERFAETDRLYDLGASVAFLFGRRWAVAIAEELRTAWASSGGIAGEGTFSLGPAWRPGESDWVRATVGFGGGGISGRVLRAGWYVPVEIAAGARVAPWLVASAWARVQWVTDEPTRDGGAAHAPFGDELYAGADLALGGEGAFVDPTFHAFLLRAGYAELRGTSGWSVGLGYLMTLSDEYEPEAE